jgi:hypothetical protein
MTGRSCSGTRGGYDGVDIGSGIFGSGNDSKNRTPRVARGMSEM